MQRGITPACGSQGHGSARGFGFVPFFFTGFDVSPHQWLPFPAEKLDEGSSLFPKEVYLHF